MLLSLAGGMITHGALCGEMDWFGIGLDLWKLKTFKKSK